MLKAGCALPLVVIFIMVVAPSAGIVFGPLIALAVIATPVLLIAGLVMAGSTSLASQTAPATLCAACGESVSFDAAYCRHCGKPQEGPSQRACTGCGSVLPGSAKFCGRCGLVAAEAGFPCSTCAALISVDSEFCGNCGAPASDRSDS
jgi:RNA polymerase subunit RPABC4/transcription elongation factor Spt4